MFWKKHKPKREKEHLDPTPVAMPVKFHRPPTLQEQIQAYTRRSLNRMAEQTGHETFEEANDFDVGEPDLVSPHEIEFGPEGEARFEEYAYNTLQARAAEQRKDGKADPAGSDPVPQTNSKLPPNAEA